jgi:hypothetical protein
MFTDLKVGTGSISDFLKGAKKSNQLYAMSRLP